MTKPADTAPNRNLFCQMVLNTDNGPEYFSGCMLKSDRVKCFDSQAVTSSRNVKVAKVVALALKARSQAGE